MKIIYATTDCPYARAYRRKLHHDGVQFEFRDIKDQQWERAWLSLTGGHRVVPVIYDTETRKATVGFHGYCEI